MHKMCAKTGNMQKYAKMHIDPETRIGEEIMVPGVCLTWKYRYATMKMHKTRNPRHYKRRG